MLTFAQFEREMTAERIKDKLQQRAEKGMWNGGSVPFGYKSVDKKLAIDKKEAEVLKRVFEHFVLTGSAFETARLVRESDIAKLHPKVPVSQSGIYYLLSNPVYIGQIKWYDKVYQGQHELSGIELRDSVVRTLAENIKKALENFKEGLERKSAVEKCLILRKTIQSIRLSKDKLEVVVLLRDSNAVLELNQSGKMAARIRGD
jgi:hypothetical protein